MIRAKRVDWLSSRDASQRRQRVAGHKPRGIPRGNAGEGPVARVVGSEHPARSVTIKRMLLGEVGIGVFVGLVSLVLTLWQAENLQDRDELFSSSQERQAEVLENTRFVRDIISSGASSRPFRELDLNDASLAGLAMGCKVLPAGEVVMQGTGVGLDKTPCSDFTEADLSQATLFNANLRGANLYGADFSNADLRATDLTRAVMYEVNASGANFQMARLDAASIGRANFSKSHFVESFMTEADAAGSIFRGALIESSELHGNMPDVDFSKATIKNSSFSNSDLFSANFDGALLDGVDFSGSDLSEAILGGSKIIALCYTSETRWPERFEPPQPACRR